MPAYANLAVPLSHRRNAYRAVLGALVLFVLTAASDAGELRRSGNISSVSISNAVTCRRDGTFGREGVPGASGSFDTGGYALVNECAGGDAHA